MSQLMKYVVLICICIAVSTGCEGMFTTPIGKIIENPREYADKTLTISGEVVDTYGLFVMKYFVLRDDTGEIPVVSNKPLPRKGNKLKVKGTVREAFSIGDRQLLVFVESDEAKQ